jgi:scyllo-inositol 2-dehydrogenase (NADP+)
MRHLRENSPNKQRLDKMKKYQKAGDIKVGVIGYGGAFNMGRAHLNEMKTAGMTPVAVAEIDESRLAVAKTDFPGIATYTSAKEMLKNSDVELLAIITPHNTHAALALQCLNAGRHVVCEKPLAITTEECDKMIAAAKKNDVVLSTYHNRHWDGCIMKAVDMVVNKKLIGDVYRIEAHMGRHGCPGDWWRTSRTISGGILYDWGVHLLEYSFQMLKGKIVEVSGFARSGYWADKTKWKADSNEDEGLAMVRLDDGTWLSLSITSLDMNSKEDRGQLEITGTKGTYVMWGDRWAMMRKDLETNVEIVEKGRNPKSEGFRLYQNIADHLVKGEKLIITGEWARRPIHVIDLAVKSAKQGRTLKAKYG